MIESTVGSGPSAPAGESTQVRIGPAGPGTSTVRCADRRERRGPRRAVPRQPAPAPPSTISISAAPAAPAASSTIASATGDRAVERRVAACKRPRLADSGKRQTDVVPRSVDLAQHRVRAVPGERVPSLAPPVDQVGAVARPRQEVSSGREVAWLRRRSPARPRPTRTCPHGSPPRVDAAEGDVAPVGRPCRRAAGARQCRDLDRHLAAGRVDREDPRPFRADRRRGRDRSRRRRAARRATRSLRQRTSRRPTIRRALRAGPGRRDPQVRMPVEDARAVEPPVDPP